MDSSSGTRWSVPELPRGSIVQPTWEPLSYGTTLRATAQSTCWAVASGHMRTGDMDCPTLPVECEPGLGPGAVPLSRLSAAPASPAQAQGSSGGSQALLEPGSWQKEGLQRGEQGGQDQPG